MTAHGVDREGNALAALPDEATILAAFQRLGAREYRRAEVIARALGIRGSRRLGVRASKGNWSGGMKPGVRLTHRLLAMHRQGKLLARMDRDYGDTWEFALPRPGETVETHPFAKRAPQQKTPERQPKPKKKNV